MSGQSPATWHEANQRYVAEALGVLRDRLERAAGDSSTRSDGLAWPEESREMTPPPAIETLARAFGLSAFERELLLLCAGVELDTALAAMPNRAQAAASTCSVARRCPVS